MATLSMESRLSLLSASEWSMIVSQGPAKSFNERQIPNPASPQLWLHYPDRVAAILGSNQKPDLIDTAWAESNQIEVGGRRSGGGLVVVDPKRSLWLDLILPRSHQWWVEDIGVSFDWVGGLWAEALAKAGQHEISTHRGPPVDREQGKLICFAGIGSGEVSIGGRKVVGLSQRRNRYGARYQCLVINDWPHQLYRALLGPGAASQDPQLIRAGAPLDLDLILDQFLLALIREAKG